jgi:hypothetical protein
MTTPTSPPSWRSLLPPRDTRAALARTGEQAATDAKPFKTATTTVAEKGRLTVDLGADRYRNFKIAAAYAGRQVSDVTRELIDGWTAENGPGELP